MKKEILISLSLIAGVSALIIGGTVAYFSDVETSTGNVFAAGEINLKIDNTCHYKGGNCPDSASNWQLTDLQDGVHKFFNFNDIKPGDWGEDTISLHVYNNDAWGWMKIYNVSNKENGCTEPEGKVDTTCGNPGVGEGELYSNLSFFIWQDDGDNIYEAGEKIIQQPGNIPTCKVWQIDGNPCCQVDPLLGSHDYYIGVKWCFGSFDQNYNCQGTAIGNEAQGDSVTLDVSFTVVQSQNNPNAQGGPTCQ